MKLFDDYNIILVNLDGLRRDKISKCKNLQKLADQSLFFSNMSTVAPFTFASLHSIISGMYPSRHGVDAYHNMFKFKSDEIITIGELLQDHGYYTCCDIISKSVMHEKGFSEYNLFDEETVNFQQRHKELIEKLSKKEKFFLFLHYTETHKHLVREIVQKYKQETNDDEFFEQIEENNERYDSYLPFCDDYIATLITTLKNCKISDKTVLIIFSDHGTSIGEKPGEKFYGVYVYDYTVNVFCIINIPGIKSQKINSLCRTIDIYPTISEIIHSKIDDNVQGKSLFDLLKIDAEDRDVFVETGGLYGPWPSPKEPNVFCIKNKSKKLIFNSNPNSWEYYDLDKDPKELSNIYDDTLQEVKELKQKLIFYFNENDIKIKIS